MSTWAARWKRGAKMLRWQLRNARQANMNILRAIGTRDALLREARREAERWRDRAYRHPHDQLNNPGPLLPWEREGGDE